jgi:hypothetical protein
MSSFDVALCGACCKNPVCFLFGCICSPCSACYFRTKALGDDWPKGYYCCQDNLPCKCCHDCSNNNPTCALMCEGCLLSPAAHLANRKVLREKYKLEDAGYESPLIGCMTLCSMLGVISAGPLAICLGCMNAQHAVELDKQTKK